MHDAYFMDGNFFENIKTRETSDNHRLDWCHGRGQINDCHEQYNTKKDTKKTRKNEFKNGAREMAEAPETSDTENGEKTEEFIFTLVVAVSHHFPWAMEAANQLLYNLFHNMNPRMVIARWLCKKRNETPNMKNAKSKGIKRRAHTTTSNV